MKHKLPVLLPYIFLGVLTLCACWLFAGRYGVFGAKVDWISQHSVLPEYFRQQFYQTGDLFTEFAPNLGGGQNIFHFSYYGLYNPIILGKRGNTGNTGMSSLLLPRFQAESLVYSSYGIGLSTLVLTVCITGILCGKWRERLLGRRIFQQ